MADRPRELRQPTRQPDFENPPGSPGEELGARRVREIHRVAEDARQESERIQRGRQPRRE